MKNLKRWTSILLVCCLCFSLAGCFDISGYLPSTPETTEDGLTTYTVTVRTHSGQYLKDVGVRVFADTAKTDLIWYDKTNENGTMSFIADTFDGYVVALENIPDGYVCANYYPLEGVENEIVLAIGLQTGVDLGSTDLKLGDGMVDMTIISRGTEYNLSSLLTTKKAVALYFFDSSSADNLAALNAAWQSCANDVAVLALNPVEDDISDFVHGISLPIAVCDNAWVSALDLYEFPTLVIVDRYGVISLIHSGIIDDAEVFRDVFAYFARNDYTAEVVKDITQIVGKVLEGTVSNPYVQDGSTDLMASVTPGGMVYYELYHVDDMILKIQSSNAWILYNGTAYYPENGVITLPLNVDDPFTPVSLGIGNTGSHTELFVGRFSYQPGTQNNPIELDLGTFTVNIKEGDEDGLFYTYKAVKPGTLRLSCLFATADIPWEHLMSNRNSGIYISSSDGILIDEVTLDQYMLLEVSANDVIEIRVGTLPSEEGLYPAGTFTMQLSYVSQEPDAPVVPPVTGTETEFSVTVQDPYGVVLPGVTVNFRDANGVTTVITDENGIARYCNALDGVTAQIVPLPGYTLHKTEFNLTPSTNNVTIVFISAMAGDFTYVQGTPAYHVSAGSTLVVMNSGAMNYVWFIPTQSGLYRFSSTASLSYWGTDPENPADQTISTYPVEDGFYLHIDAVGEGAGYLIGMTGQPYSTITIQWLSNGDPIS